MIHGQRRPRTPALAVVAVAGNMLWLASSAVGFQTPHAVPPTRERQCVQTGSIPPGGVRTITVTWKRPFATADYDIVGSVAQSGDGNRDIELGHIVMPHTPAAAAAVIYNRDTNAPQAGVLCLDAATE